MHRVGRALVAIASAWMIRGGAAAAQPAPLPAAPAPAEGSPPAPPAATPAPPNTVTGRVGDAVGRPIRGATVRREDGAGQATTDADGRFSIEAPVITTLVI